ncbi:nickel-dependent hydrogenase large subunit [Metallibacterium sp.]|uniref:hydrogenase large subunit n=1 Tax=Metallibacterium sp. TaxID=2940281 RepID=UPI00260C8CF9|nr:nickel-dependent hydrogenase large subunit [Metallibacterium sp.]
MSNMLVLHLRATDVPGNIENLLVQGGRMQMVYASSVDGRIEACYLAAPGAGKPFELWRVAVPPGGLPSMAAHVPLLGWYEREMQDLSGVGVLDHPEPYALVIERGTDPAPFFAATDDGHYPAPHVLPEVEGDDVQELDFGPIRADVFESGQFRFFYIGERILRYHPRLFLKHRGMEKRFQGLVPDAAVVLAERVSGVGALAHALAFCQAIEDAAGIEAPPRARVWRSVLAEMERLYNHLHYLGVLADATTLKVGQAEGRLLEEQAKQLTARVCGHRLPMNVLRPGGLRRDLALPSDFVAHLGKLESASLRYLDQLEVTSSFLDRLHTTGSLPRQVAFDQGATGPVERASDLDRDLRRDHPYAAYAEHAPDIALHKDGDAYARYRVRGAELRASFVLLRHLLAHLAPGPVLAPCAAPADSIGLGWAESPRGSVYYVVHTDASGRLARVKIKSPSYSNWRVFPYTVHGTNMMDYAINEASFGSTIAGCDR